MSLSRQRLQKPLSAMHPKWGPNRGLRALSARAHYVSAAPSFLLCFALGNWEDSGLTYFLKGIAKTQLKRDDKATLLESVRSGHSAPWHGMTKEEAVRMLI